jgi:hypothetical protein
VEKVKGRFDAPIENTCPFFSNLPKKVRLQVDQKRSDTRHPISGGVRRTYEYAATTRDEGNAVDERFSATC